MSQRVKKPGNKIDDSNGKRRRRRGSASEAEEEGTRSGSNSGLLCNYPVWTPRHLNDLKVSSIYNRNSAEAPAELYRKDLISAMKLADSEPLTPEEYWLITDPWKQEWEKGVQVPVNPESLPEPEVVVISPVNERSHDFRLPKKKYIRVTHDDFFNPDYHQLVSTAARAEKVCSYDLDDIDASWLSCANSDRGMQNLPVISEFLMEQVIEELELQCWEQVQTILKSQEGLGIEYDENVICDVCRSPESEEGNEMVFCDACNICVHQACYGITTIPSGSWLCRTCSKCRPNSLGIRPSCVLCPNMGGAMKATRSGQKWAHVACAIWIPEVSIGSVEKMEPITKISAIPQSRWSLVCVLCKEKAGACIQCSVKTCKTAYHVTCAFKNGLEMKPIIVDENAEDGIKLRSYCQKHSVNTKKDKSAHSGSEEDAEKKRVKAMTAEERNQARAEKLQQIESEFYKYVRLKDVAQNLAVDMDIVMLVYNFWKLKRKSLNNRPLVPPRPETTQLLTQQQEQDLEQMKMFVQLRQDLERVRNLCYMVSRREKLSRSYFRLREQTFQKQVAILGEKSADSLNAEERSAILAANHGPSIYDQLYSMESTNVACKDYDTLVSLIAGEDKKDKLINGVIKPKKSIASNALANIINSTNSFKKQFVNGARKKNLLGECSSVSESDASISDATAAARKKVLGGSGRKPLSYLFDSDSSMDGGSLGGEKSINKKLVKGSSPKRGVKSTKKSSSSESEDLDISLAKGNGTGKTEAPIYSDSDSDAVSARRAGSPMATKAAFKEFSKKSNKTGAQPSRKGTVARKKKGLPPTDLIVPQREAAKKATESIKSVKPKKEGDSSSVKDFQISSPSSRANDRESDSFEKTAFEKFKDIAAASVQDKQKKGRVKATESRRGGTTRKRPNEESPLDLLDPELRDQFEFDGSNDSKNVPNFVPQRQAAKKAAEHIRSGLSNIVAARLIIEDEMEATTKKKLKGEKLKNAQVSAVILGKKGNKIKGSVREETDESPSTGDRQRSRKRTLSKEDKGKGKGSRSSTSAEIPSSDRTTDWPFLDRGSQSACRRSRERSSSSSSSSSSGSSSSDSSSSSRSSASSSPASASPESISAPRKAPSLLSNAPSSKPAGFSATHRGPGRKLKTSDRSPDSGSRNATVTGKKPATKGSGPAKLRSGRGSIGSNKNSPTKSYHDPITTDDEFHTKQSKIARSRSSSSSSSDRSLSPSSPTRVPNKNHQPAQAKGKRGTRESPRSKEKDKAVPSKTRPSPSKSIAQSQKRTTSKALDSGTVNLSSDSESDKDDRKLPDRNNSQPRDSKPGPRSKTNNNRKDIHADPVLAEEKENSDIKSSQRIESPSHTRNRTPKSSGAGFSTSVLSPLTPSAENKEKDTPHKHSDTEPELKRARLESGRTNDDLSSSHVPLGPGSGPSLFSSSSAILSAKSLFSPKVNHESDLVDFDSELYDLARSVSADYSQVDEEGGPAASTLPFFSQSFISREEPVEDSPQATLNLVEKLRLQHARKSGCPRSSLDGPDLSDSSNPLKSPSLPKHPLDASSDTSSTTRPGSAVAADRSCDDQDMTGEIPPKTSASSASISPENSKLAQGDERWVPPSSRTANDLDGKKEFGSADHGEEMKQGSDPLRLPESKSHLHPLSVSLASPPAMSPLSVNTSPGGAISSHGGIQSVLYAQSSGAGPHPSFMYPLPGGQTVPISQNSRRPSFLTPSLSPGYSSNKTFPGASHFLLGKQTTPTTDSSLSPSSSNQRRTTAPSCVDDNMTTVTSGMPHLAKPSLASPSMILAANKNTHLPAPPQSTVAQIIENVVNNHANNPNSFGPQELLNVMLGLSSAQHMHTDAVSVDSCKPSVASPQGIKEINKLMSPGLPNETEPHSKLAENATGKSPRGRGRRATTPRSATGPASSLPIKTEKILTNSETNGMKPRGRGERKQNTSPARAKPSTPGRGRGRGKGKGKGMVATRKDLAGTVYDIDFDEFEENVDEKLNLRSLRERRKSSELHSTPGPEPIPLPQDSTLSGFSSIVKDSEASPKPLPSLQQKLSTPPQASAANETIPPMLQMALPAPMDMRTYSGIGGETEITKVAQGSVNIPALYSTNSNKSSLELEEFNKAKTMIPPSISTGIDSGPSLGVESLGPTIIQSMDHSRDVENGGVADFSRNQLKVKIKGPFLDANYGSHSIGDSSVSQHFSPSLHHHPVGTNQMVNVPVNNPSNLRRMRKKELLRQYWNQDMNMDGSSVGPSHESEIPHSSMVHRSVITIPKAVASMAIIPTKDDYRESLPNEDPLNINPSGLPNNTLKPTTVEKRKRNRGIREMAALGIITCDSPRERRRDRGEAGLPSSNFTTEVGKKRGKTTKRPIRSTFIPPTLVETDQPGIDKKPNLLKPGTVPNNSNPVVTAVNHPTPKLKIKFGDLSKGTSTTTTVSASNHVTGDTSDKETPNKKAKGRPPKKRGIELAAAAPPSMEELKRESMKFREMVMQDFAVEERKETQHTSRKHKKHKRKGGAVNNNEEGANTTPASEVKVIADGSTKLILRFGKSRTSLTGNDGNERDTKPKDSEMHTDMENENDSGFTGSSEGSTGSHIEGPPPKEKPEVLSAIKVEPGSSSMSSQVKTVDVPANSGSTTSMEVNCNDISRPEIKPTANANESCGFQSDKIMPIRLKLSRCFEGYALKKKQENCVPSDNVPPAPPKQTDSCEVR